MRAKRSDSATAASSPVAPLGLEELFAAEYKPMFKLALAMLGVGRDAEEVVQDAFVGVASRWDTLDNPGGYLRVSVVNGARKQIRSRIRKADVEASARVTLGAARDLDAYLLDVVDGLPDRQRIAVVLTYYSGLNSTEVGELLDCPAATVRSLVHRALEQLRKEVTR